MHATHYVVITFFCWFLSFDVQAAFQFPTDEQSSDSRVLGAFPSCKAVVEQPNIPSDVTLNPTTLPVNSDINDYFKSGLNLLFSTREEVKIFNDGCQELIKTYGPNWRARGNEAVKFLWSLVGKDFYKCQFWIPLCGMSMGLEWDLFVEWKKQTMPSVPKADEVDVTRDLALVWTQLNGDVEGFTQWADCLTRGMDMREKSHIFQDFVSVWTQLDGNVEGFTQWANWVTQGMHVERKFHVFQSLAPFWIQRHVQSPYFDWWASSITQYPSMLGKAAVLQYLASVWKQLEGDVEGFMEWAMPKTQGMNELDRTMALKHLASVWKQLEGNVKDFMEWATPMTQGEGKPDQAMALQYLASVWKQLEGNVKDFMEWAMPKTQGMEVQCQVRVLQGYVSVWEILDGQMDWFMGWVSSIEQCLGVHITCPVLKNLASIWKNDMKDDFELYRSEFPKLDSPSKKPASPLNSQNVALGFAQVVRNYIQQKTSAGSVFEPFRRPNEIAADKL